ncbi:MAG: YraN family protein [Acidobacteria bacterium]|nr:YraN family protein [Acidobacteriota bacterium]
MRRWNESAALGRRGEDLAHRYLERAGLTVVERNWVGPGLRAEVDLIAWDGDVLVFVEVKSRRNMDFASPERAMDSLKRAQVISAARHFLRRWQMEESRARFDLVTIVFEPFQVEHQRDAWTFDEPVRVS